MKKNGQVDSLNELCLKYLAEHFTEVITENEIPFVYMNKIITRLPVDLPPLISAKYIDDENYWKRCCFHKYSRHECLVENHGSSWKRLYFEKLLTEQLESFHSGSDIFELLEFVDSIKNIVYCIQLEQLPSHIDSTKILTILSNIETIDIKYRMKKIGINYNRLLFGMKMSDALYLADSIGEMKKLHTLKLTENEMDDDILNALMTGLLNNESIQYLDISHNKISNDGARLVSRLISNNDSLRKIDLSDNNIDDEGAKHMARALIKGSKITGLSLRLNKMSDEGVRCLFEGLQGCKDLEFLDVSFNKGSDQVSNIYYILQPYFISYFVVL